MLEVEGPIDGGIIKDKSGNRRKQMGDRLSVACFFRPSATFEVAGTFHKQANIQRMNGQTAAAKPQTRRRYIHH